MIRGCLVVLAVAAGLAGFTAPIRVDKAGS